MSSAVLIVRADDAGSFRSANRALAAALATGLVRNVSVMAPAPHFEDAARLLRNADVCVGLHVTLTSEWPGVRWRPVTEDAANLAGPDGAFFSSALELFERGVDLERAMAEVRAQLVRARTSGLDVRYVDEHMGVGWVHETGREQPRLRDQLRTWAASEGLLWHETLARELPDEVALLQKDAHAFARATAALPAGRYVWVVHPAHDDDEVQRGTQSRAVARARASDLATLVDPELGAALERAGVRVARYDEDGG